MATAVQKITLASSRDIPFNKLVLSQANVRQIKAGVSVDDLAASIARRGLIQSLHVRAVLDGEGQETGMFEVPAGGRRYRALELLVKGKRLAKTAPVPCVVSDASSGILIEEISLAENDERAPLHPLDQYRAFQAMREKSMTEEAIAAAFFVGVNVVKQRLRLASVSPALLNVYAEDGMTLEQLMAFTVSEDHARQAEVWEAIRSSWQKEPWQIRRMLTEKAVRAAEKRARFVAVEDEHAQALVTIRPRGGRETRRLAVQCILDATGIGRVAETDDPLLRRLIARGLVRPGPFGIGLDAGADYAAIGHEATPLWILGPLLRGVLWECVAVPDIRNEAADLAGLVAARFGQAQAA